MSKDMAVHGTLHRTNLDLMSEDYALVTKPYTKVYHSKMTNNYLTEKQRNVQAANRYHTLFRLPNQKRRAAYLQRLSDARHVPPAAGPAAGGGSGSGDDDNGENENEQNSSNDDGGTGDGVIDLTYSNDSANSANENNEDENENDINNHDEHYNENNEGNDEEDGENENEENSNADGGTTNHGDGVIDLTYSTDEDE